MKTKTGSSLAVALTAALLSQPMSASVTYVYTGNPFTDVSGPYTTNDMVTGFVEFSSPFPANMSFSTVTPLSFSFSDGVKTITNSAEATNFQFGTAPSGAITAWTVFMQIPGGEISTDSGGALATGDLGNMWVPPPPVGGFTDVPGTWTIFQTPDTGSSTLALLSLSLTALGVVIRQFKRAAVSI